jgi:hypothetical protein
MTKSSVSNTAFSYILFWRDEFNPFLESTFRKRQKQFSSQEGEMESILQSRNCGVYDVLWLAIVSFVRILDLINLILDAVLIRKMFPLEEGAVWGKILLVATVATFLFFNLLGASIMRWIESLKPARTPIQKGDTYYIVWILLEMGSFLVEDATTIYIYVFIDGVYDSQNSADVLNLHSSIASGIAFLLILFPSFYVYCSVYEKCIPFTIIAIIGVVYPIGTAVNFLNHVGHDQQSEDVSRGVYIIMSVVGYFVLIDLVYMMVPCNLDSKDIYFRTLDGDRITLEEIQSERYLPSTNHQDIPDLEQSS